jgi:RNA polymerase sigma factor (sigma-70 family)
MADEPNELAALLERVAQGDKQAAEEVYEKYHKAILMVVRYHLNQYPRLRALCDSTDFVQDVWLEILAHPEKLRGFSAREVFCKFLEAVARHKVQKAQRKYAAQKRDLRRRRHLSDSGVAAVAAAAADPHPDPARQAATLDEWMHWLGSLTPRQQLIVLMRRNGCTYQEIAAQIGCSKRSMRRLLAVLRSLSPEPLP